MINTVKKSGFGLSRKASLLAATLGVLCMGEASAAATIIDDNTAATYSSPWTVTGKVHATVTTTGTLSTLTLNAGAELYLNCSAALTGTTCTLNAGSKLHLLLGADQTFADLGMSKGASLFVAGAHTQTLTALTLNDPNVYFGLACAGLTIPAITTATKSTVFEFLNSTGATLTGTGVPTCTLKMTKDGTLATISGLKGVISGPGKLTAGAVAAIESVGVNRKGGSINIPTTVLSKVTDCSVFGTGISVIDKNITYTPNQNFDGTYNPGIFAGTLDINTASTFTSASAPLQITAVTKGHNLTLAGSAGTTTIRGFDGNNFPTTITGTIKINKATIGSVTIG